MDFEEVQKLRAKIYYLEEAAEREDNPFKRAKLLKEVEKTRAKIKKAGHTP